MIQMILEAVIRDLGPTGVLLVGLWFISKKMADKIIQNLDCIAKDLKNTQATIDAINSKIKVRQHG